MNVRMAGVALVLVLGAATAACGDSGRPRAGARAELEGPTWVLDTRATPIGTPAGRVGVPAGRVEVSARFAAGHVTGSTGCNDYAAEYHSSPPALRIDGAHVTTHRACTTATGPVETAYLGRLAQVRRAALGSRTLTLRDASGRTVLSFTAAAGRG